MTKIAAAAALILLLTAAGTGAEIPADPEWTHAKLVTETIKEILLAVAILVGGAWAVWRYIYLESHHAQRKAKLKESPPHINITIDHDLYKRDDGSYNLVGNIEMKHTGNGQQFFDLETIDPIIVCRLIQNDQGDFDTTEKSMRPRIMSTENFHDGTLYPEGSASLKFIQKVEDKNVYLVEFKSRIAEKLMPNSRTQSANEQSNNQDDGLKMYTSWIGTKIVHVGIKKEESQEASKTKDAETRQNN